MHEESGRNPAKPTAAHGRSLGNERTGTKGIAVFNASDKHTGRTTSVVAALAAVATLGMGLVAPAASAASADMAASNVTFQWGVNDESGGGAYFGGCNFLSAGEAGDNGAAGIWPNDNTFYSTKTGNVEILKPTADGTLAEPTWKTKCTNQYGTNINGITAGMTFTPTDSRKDPNAPADAPAEQPTYSGNVVRISNGTGTVNPTTDSAHIEWKGSFTIVYYGGMTYWSITDPVLDVKDGKGTITATASGYGADMDDASKWLKLDPQEIHIADLQNTKVDVTDKGITVTPDFLGVKVPEDVVGRNDQVEKDDTNAAWWGSFPASWLKFSMLTGQTSYWWTSAGTAKTIQIRKPASPITITYTATSLDSTAPTFTGVDDATVKVGASFDAKAGVTATDDVDGKVEFTVDGSVDTSKAGTYKLTYTATDAAGNKATVTRTITVAALAPATPAKPTVKAASTSSVTVEWAAPANDGGSPITGYVVTLTPSIGDAQTKQVAADATAVTFDKLDAKGASYTATIKAVNAVGESQSSPASDAVVPNPNPGANLGISVSPSNDIDPAVKNTFTVKGTGFTGGAAQYGAYAFVIDSAIWKPGEKFETAFSKQTAGVTWVQPKQIADGSFTATIDVEAGKLEYGKTYIVGTVAAHGLSLTDRRLDQAQTITLKAQIPTAPVNVTIARSGETDAKTNATVSWQAPAAGTYDAKVAEYQVALSDRNGKVIETKTVPAAEDTDAYSVVFENVAKPGASLKASVTAYDANKAASKTVESAALSIPAVAPDAPKGVTVAKGGANQLIVSWQAPEHDGGAAITAYVVKLTAEGAADGDANAVVTAEVAADARQHTFSGLDANKAYRASVVAANSAGKSDAAVADKAVAPDAAQPGNGGSGNDGSGTGSDSGNGSGAGNGTGNTGTGNDGNNGAGSNGTDATGDKTQQTIAKKQSDKLASTGVAASGIAIAATLMVALAGSLAVARRRA